MKQRKAKARSSEPRKGQTKRDALLERVRRFALDERRAEPQTFLSLRDAASRFRAPLPRIAAVYRQLTKEGILGTVRGSRTILHGKGSGRVLKVRGIIGVPVSINRFVSLPDYRNCFLRLREELHARGFATACIFLERSELDEEAIVRRLAVEKAELALWLLPDGATRDTPLRLRDHGIRFVGINLAELSGMPCQYHVMRRDAIRTVLRRWRSELNLTGAAIARPHQEEPLEAERIERLQTLIEGEEFRVEIVRVPTGRPLETAKELCSKRRLGLVLPGPASAILSRYAPQTALNVLSVCHAALIDGPIDLPITAHSTDAKVDVVTIDWAEIATRVAEEIVAGEAIEGTEPTIFRSHARLRVPIDRLNGGDLTPNNRKPAHAQAVR